MLERLHRLAHSLLAAKNPATYQMLHRISLFPTHGGHCLPDGGRQPMNALRTQL
jgi:hypothetical protein